MQSVYTNRDIYMWNGHFQYTTQKEPFDGLISIFFTFQQTNQSELLDMVRRNNLLDLCVATWNMCEYCAKFSRDYSATRNRSEAFFNLVEILTWVRYHLFCCRFSKKKFKSNSTQICKKLDCFMFFLLSSYNHVLEIKEKCNEIRLIPQYL